MSKIKTAEIRPNILSEAGSDVCGIAREERAIHATREGGDAGLGKSEDFFAGGHGL